MTRPPHKAFWCVILASLLMGVHAFATAPATRPTTAPTKRPASRPAPTKRPSTRPTKPTKVAKVPIAEARQAAFQILMNRCGKCHIKSLTTAQKGALRVFNLDSRRWWHTIRVSQLISLRDMFVHSSGHFPKHEKEQIVRFVRMERQLRNMTKRSASRPSSGQ